jgi:hypothetical protein
MTAQPELQQGLFPAHKPIAQRFAEWKMTPGAGKVMQHFYRWAARYHRRFLQNKIGVSQRLIEELARDEIRTRQLRSAPENGYALNSHFTAQIARHMVAEHPEWRDMFILRKTGVTRRKRKVVVIEERISE